LLPPLLDGRDPAARPPHTPYDESEGSETFDSMRLRMTYCVVDNGFER
jgi:hypothetical protein